MRRILSVKAFGCAAALSTAIAVIVATGSASALTINAASVTKASTAKSSAAGQPTPTSYLLCGTFTTNPMERQTGSEVHFMFSTMGMSYDYSGQNCDSEYGQSGNGTFTWTITHGNVQANPSNPQYERGTEHGIATLSADANKNAGFNGRVTNYDFNGFAPPDACPSSNRDIYYASGHEDPQANTCSPLAPGNFNTHGGAATGDHFNGKYGTVVYQDESTSSSYTNSPCQSGSMNYCFEAVLVGKTN